MTFLTFVGNSLVMAWFMGYALGLVFITLQKFVEKVK